MAGRHASRSGWPGAMSVVIAHPYWTGSAATAAVVAALVVVPLATTDQQPIPARTPAAVATRAPAIARSVPDVVGLAGPRAVGTLHERGFSAELRAVSGAAVADAKNCVVTHQSPDAGAHVSNGSNVVLTVAPAGTPMTTPSPNAGGSPVSGVGPAPAGSTIPAKPGGGSAVPPAPAVPAPAPAPVPAPAPAPAPVPVPVPAPAPAPGPAPAPIPAPAPAPVPAPAPAPAPPPGLPLPVPLPTIPVPKAPTLSQLGLGAVARLAIS